MVTYFTYKTESVMLSHLKTGDELDFGGKFIVLNRNLIGHKVCGKLGYEPWQNRPHGPLTIKSSCPFRKLADQLLYC